MVESSWSGYHDSRFANAGDSGQEALEANVSRLLLMLMLARVDGKSPVEYLRETGQEQVRSFAVPRLQCGSVSLSELTTEWFT